MGKTRRQDSGGVGVVFRNWLDACADTKLWALVKKANALGSMHTHSSTVLDPLLSRFVSFFFQNYMRCHFISTLNINSVLSIKLNPINGGVKLYPLKLHMMRPLGLINYYATYCIHRKVHQFTKQQMILFYFIIYILYSTLGCDVRKLR